VIEIPALIAAILLLTIVSALTFLSHIPIKLPIVILAFDAKAWTHILINLAINKRKTKAIIIAMIARIATMGFIMFTTS